MFKARKPEQKQQLFDTWWKGVSKHPFPIGKGEAKVVFNDVLNLLSGDFTYEELKNHPEKALALAVLNDEEDSFGPLYDLLVEKGWLLPTKITNCTVKDLPMPGEEWINKKNQTFIITHVSCDGRITGNRNHKRIMVGYRENSNYHCFAMELGRFLQYAKKISN